jgi:hypothetical protein
MDDSLACKERIRWLKTKNDGGRVVFSRRESLSVLLRARGLSKNPQATEEFLAKVFPHPEVRPA